MTAKQYLSSLRRLDVAIAQKRDELAALRAEVGHVSSVDFSSERVNTSASLEAPFVNKIIKLMDLEAEILSDLVRLFETRHTIVNQILELPNSNEAVVLYERYVRFHTFEDIARRMHYSVRNVHYIHGRALAEFEEKFLK